MRRFGELEAAIMGLLWSYDAAATVRQVHTDLQPGRELAYTTVLTVMDILFKKGWLRREPAGRAYRYTPTASRAEYSARLLREALDGAGNPAEALVHFVGQMSPTETKALRAALAGHERKQQK